MIVSNIPKIADNLILKIYTNSKILEKSLF